jgi:hypothetical protein
MVIQCWQQTNGMRKLIESKNDYLIRFHRLYTHRIEIERVLYAVLFGGNDEHARI